VWLAGVRQSNSFRNDFPRGAPVRLWLS